MDLNKALRGVKLYQEIKDKKLISVSFGVYNGTLRVYINKMSSNLKDQELVFSFGLTTLNGRLIAEELLTLNDKTDPHETTFILKGPKYVDNQRIYDETVLTAKVTIKRALNKQGKLINMIMFTSPTEQVFRFLLMPTPYIEIMVDGKIVKDEAILTTKITNAFAKNFEAVLNILPEGLEMERPKNGKPRY